MFVYAKISNVSLLGVVDYTSLNRYTVLSHSLDMRLTKGRMMMLL